MATVFCRLRSLAPLAVGLALCTGPRAVNAQEPIEPKYEKLLDEVNVSGDVFLGIMTGDTITEVKPDGSAMHVYVWIPEKLVADTMDPALCVRVQSIDGLYEAVLEVTSDDKLKKEDADGAYELAYTTEYKNEFGVRQANEVALHAFWSADCEAPGDSVTRLVATWDRASAYPDTIWLLLNNPEGRARLETGPKDEGQRCRSLEAINRTLIAYDKVCKAGLKRASVTDTLVTLEVHRWDGIEFQGIKTIHLERPVDHAEPAWTASPPDSSP